MNPTYIVLHHSRTKDTETVSWGAIRDYHLGLGWSDIGYHYGIEFARTQYEIFLGRMPDVRGAHCPQGGMNRKAIGICVVGNFDYLPPHPVVWDKTKNLARFLMRHYGIEASRVTGHREWNPKKTCPGSKWDMDKFRMELRG